MRFNMKSGLASQRKLSAPAVDFPRVNEYYTGRYISTAGASNLMKELNIYIEKPSSLSLCVYS